MVRAELTGKVLNYNTQWVLKIKPDETFFVGYGGQGRKRWHYGIAHGILQGLKDDLIKINGRGWIYHPRHRDYLVQRPTETFNLYWFDAQEVWEILYAHLIVGFAIFGAFYLSYFTPTVGLGCRSGGYMIFFIIAFSMTAIEMFAWWATHRRSVLRQYFRLLLRFMELVNAGWLVYILIAQTFGIYRSCRCMSSMWSSIGGYIDFNYSVDYTGYDVQARWATGTAMGLSMMSIATIYIVKEWMMQSHLWTEDYEKAMKGLENTRRTRRVIHQINLRIDWIGRFVGNLWEGLMDRVRGEPRGLRRRTTVELEMGAPKRTDTVYSGNYDRLESSTTI